MSKSKLRQEGNCLNCGEHVHVRFCSHCGQENKVPHETFWGLLVHFVEDIFHYDGKLFSSIRILFTKPGYLSSEYLHGKRTTYLHPIRFYLFTSAFFFICLFYVFHPLEKYVETKGPKTKVEQSESILQIQSGFMQGNKDNPKTYEAYLAAQAKLPKVSRDSEFEQKLVKQVYSISKEYTSPSDLIEALVDIMLHKLSTLLFIALPLLGFILHLVFIRRKGFYYMHHGIFVLHSTTSLFIVLFVSEFLGILSSAVRVSGLHAMSNGLMLAWFIYYFVAFKRFYQLGWKKAVVLTIISSFLQLIVLTCIFFGLLIFSFFSL